MSKPFSELRKKMSPERRVRVSEAVLRELLGFEVGINNGSFWIRRGETWTQPCTNEEVAMWKLLLTWDSTK